MAGSTGLRVRSDCSRYSSTTAQMLFAPQRRGEPPQYLPVIVVLSVPGDPWRRLRNS